MLDWLLGDESETLRRRAVFYHMRQQMHAHPVEREDFVVDVEDDRPWPWCDACRSYHHPNNPTCYLRAGMPDSVELSRARRHLWRSQ